MRKPVLVAVMAAALAVLGSTPAYAQPSGEPEPVPTETVVEPPPVTTDPVDPPPVDPPPTSDPVDPPPTSDPVVPPTSDPVVPPTSDPVVPPTSDPVVPPTSDPVVPPTSDPVVPPTSNPVDPPPTSDPAAPTTAPSGTETTAPTTPPITEIDVDIEYDDRDDYSVNIEDNSTVVFEGDRYSNTYVYTDTDGRTVRANDCGCHDFDSNLAAQRFFDATGRSLYWLDTDGDGHVCESELGEFTKDTARTVGVRGGSQVSVLPYGSVDTGRAA